MEIKVGIKHVTREVVVDSTDSAEEVTQAITQAIADGDGILTLNQERGGRVLIPVDSIAYVELGEEGTRRLGFGAV